MLKRTCYSSLMVVFFLFSTGNAQDADPVLGKLGDYLVRQSDMDRFIGYHPASEQKGIRESPDRMLSLLRRMLEAKAVANIARQEKFHERPEVKEQLGYIEDDFLSREYLKKVVMAGVKVTEEEMREYYRENEESLAAPEQVRVRQILIRTSSSFTEEEKKKTRERAQHVLDRLREGEDFIRAVSKYSEDPDPEVRKSGGDLGFFTRGQMIEVIEDAAFSLKPGEISDLIETPFGFHIIRLEEYVEPKPRSFQEVKDL
ncbi:MAG: peptidylprolyl isomerase, partial [Deltaproteobacteria bacterium]|nr:peptidylprolyl isomerase [Deltaproteobacteria bacterium]